MGLDALETFLSATRTATSTLQMTAILKLSKAGLPGSAISIYDAERPDRPDQKDLGQINI